MYSPCCHHKFNIQLLRYLGITRKGGTPTATYYMTGFQTELNPLSILLWWQSNQKLTKGNSIIRRYPTNNILLLLFRHTRHRWFQGEGRRSDDDVIVGRPPDTKQGGTENNIISTLRRPREFLFHSCYDTQ